MDKCFRLSRFIPIFMLVSVIIFLSTTAAVACPDCNIHNNLAKSVRSSNDIIIAEVIRKLDDNTAEVKVTKVLRGNRQAGEMVTFKLSEADKKIGKSFIFSNPTAWPPRYEILPNELEDEVTFLIKEKPSVDNIQDAVKRVQGVSVETKRIGMDYIRNHHNAAIKPLIAELNTLMPQVFTKDDICFGENKLNQLVEALFLEPTDAGKNFALAQIDAFGAKNQTEIAWKANPMYPSSYGIFLKNLLCQTQKHQLIAATINIHLKQIYQKLSGSVLAEASFAVILSDVASPEELNSWIKSDEAVDMLALGIFFAGNDEASWWQYDKAYDLWDTALFIAKKQELHDMISQRIADSEQHWKRKERKHTKNSSALQTPSNSNSKLTRFEK